MNPLRFGIVGTGQMAANFAAELGALEGAGIVAAAVASRSRAGAEAFAAKHGIERAFGSYEALAADPDIDVAYIATPHVHHEAHTLLCLRAGKHVLCEKPLAINVAQADRMIECARANGRFLMEALWTRFLPAFRAAREQVAAGTLGRISLISGGGAFVPGPSPDQYLLNRSLGGGVLLIFFGVSTFASDPLHGRGLDQVPSGQVAVPSLVRAFASTLALTITNPATLFGFATLFATLGGLSGSKASFGYAALVVAGVVSGSTLWWFTLTTIVGLFHARIDAGVMKYINRGSGVLVTLSGVGVLGHLLFSRFL